MGFIAPIFSLIGALAPLLMMGSQGGQAAPPPPAPPPPAPPPEPKPEEAADVEVAKRRYLTRQKQKDERSLLAIEDLEEDLLKRKTLLGE
jgi:hypothetical protein